MHESKFEQLVSLFMGELKASREQRQHEFEWHKSHRGLATKLDLERLEKTIMSAISEYAAAVNTSFDEIDSALESVTKSVTGVADDVTYLKETIDKLQNNPGPISDEDQALLNAAQSRAASAASKLTAAKTALVELDAATERPEVPPQG
jgi:enamine deaminase RidA (YjgF/YER057c/UK114 family)